MMRSRFPGIMLALAASVALLGCGKEEPPPPPAPTAPPPKPEITVKLGHARIYAPMTGVVVAKHADVGALASNHRIVRRSENIRGIKTPTYANAVGSGGKSVPLRSAPERFPPSASSAAMPWSDPR